MGAENGKDDFDIDAELKAAGKALDKDAEVDRILSVFKLNAYAVLDLLPGVPQSDIKKAYRTKSLLIHPDQNPNPQAPEAFDRLKNAQTVLTDDKQREQLEEYISDARMLVMREKKLTADDEETRGEEFAKAWREKTTWVIMDEEKRKRRRMEAQLREEGREKRKEDEEAQERKRKREHDDAWEKTRESRISSWRDYQQGKGSSVGGGEKGAPEGKKKKKMKMKVVG